MKAAFDEIRKIAYRAMDGAGVPPGVADDSAWATATLCAAGHDGMRMLADALDGFDGTPGDCSLDVPDLAGAERVHLAAAGKSAAFLAPGLADLMALGKPVHVTDLMHSLFLLPFSIRSSSFVATPLAREQASVNLTPVANADMPVFTSAVEHAIHNGIPVHQKSHARVYAYSRAILVPESEASRLTGAGAGLTDND